jgi:type II secretory ATPase GspE/PulE/Tfp pilus assembly ATPase PilB-like protein
MKSEFEAILRQMKDASLTKEARDGATVKIVNTLLLYAAKNGASDVHIEPYREKILVRF